MLDVSRAQYDENSVLVFLPIQPLSLQYLSLQCPFLVCIARYIGNFEIRSSTLTRPPEDNLSDARRVFVFLFSSIIGDAMLRNFLPAATALPTATSSHKARTNLLISSYGKPAQASPVPEAVTTRES